ncbi:MAG: hypothetical protein ACLRSE_12770 [Alistipes finegoldii]
MNRVLCTTTCPTGVATVSPYSARMTRLVSCRVTNLSSKSVSSILPFLSGVTSSESFCLELSLMKSTSIGERPYRSAVRSPSRTE